MVVLKQRTTQIPVLTFLYCPNQRVVLGYPGPVPYTQIQEIRHVSSEICILAPETIIFCGGRPSWFIPSTGIKT